MFGMIGKVGKIGKLDMRGMFGNPRRRLYGLALSLLATTTLMQCNIFSPFAQADSDLDYEGLVLRGNQAINDGDFRRAESLFQRAIEVDYRGSEAHLFHAKALLRLYNVRYTRLNDEFNRKRGSDVKGIPFIDEATTLAGADSLYYPIARSVRDLEHIVRVPRDTLFLGLDSFPLPPDGDTAGDGVVRPDVALLDLGLLQAVKAMFAPIDLDKNLRLDSACGMEICATPDPTCNRYAEFLDVCPDGRSSEAVFFERYKRFTMGVDIDSLSTDNLDPKDLSNNPNDINQFLDAMRGPIAGASFNLDSVNTAIDLYDKGDTKLNEQLQDVIGDISDLNSFIGYMRYDDSLDNDFDAMTPARLKQPGAIMVWHDYDKNGYIRFDYDEPVNPLVPGAGDIGHPMHRHARPELYVSYDSLVARFPHLGQATGKNSRLGNMKQRCHDVTDDLPSSVAPIVPEIRAMCDSLSSALKPSVTPPARSDWVSGPFGVDEEIIDERDNDYDGLKDEDTRNARGMDDDDDAALTLSMIGSIPPPMLWSDDNGNGCIDIDKDQDQTGLEYPEIHCMGQPHHRLRLAKEVPDSLPIYYSAFTSQSKRDDCLDDIERLPSAFIADYNQAERLLACQYKHTWIASRPPNSEWTGGTNGIDEELPDGKDNDGDGWVDEDLR